MNEIVELARKKASKMNKHLNYRVVAVGLSRKGDLVGIRTNSFGLKSGKKNGKHAERELLKRYGNRVRSIVLLRFGYSGGILPIKPCENCQKLLDKLGVKVVTFETQGTEK